MEQRTSAGSEHASGTFDVELEPMSSDDGGDGTSLGRMSLEKRFHGELEATSSGEMLTARTPIDDSAGYVAIERVSGSLGGRSGSFVLQHNGIMDRGAQQLTVRVVPDSGSGELAGLEGEMTIAIADGEHSYRFEYCLPDAH